MFDSNGKKYGPLVHDIDGFKIEVFFERISFYNLYLGIRLSTKI